MAKQLLTMLVLMAARVVLVEALVAAKGDHLQKMLALAAVTAGTAAVLLIMQAAKDKAAQRESFQKHQVNCTLAVELEKVVRTVPLALVAAVIRAVLAQQIKAAAVALMPVQAVLEL